MYDLDWEEYEYNLKNATVTVVREFIIKKE